MRFTSPSPSWLAFGLVAACAAKPPAAPAPVDLGPIEEEVLRELASTDGRIARRAHLLPSEDDARRATMTALAAGDASLAGPGIDPFSFEARARSLAAAQGTLARRGGPDLVRLVAEETLRLEEERRLPRSASALVGAIVDGWQSPRSEREAGDDDRWLAHRLDEVREILEHDPLDVIRARDLDDALDRLEHIATGLVRTTQALVRLREVLDAARPGNTPMESPGKALFTYLGVKESADRIAGLLAETEASLRPRTEAALAERDRELEGALFVPGPCADAVPGSRVRSMAAPPEREPSCQLRHAVVRETDAHVLALLHDYVVVGQWAVDALRGGTIARSEGEHHLLVPLSRPEFRARYEKTALAHPVAAIGAALTARLLAGDPRSRAKAWAALGDVPLDVAETALVSGPVI